MADWHALSKGLLQTGTVHSGSIQIKVNCRFRCGGANGGLMGVAAAARYMLQRMACRSNFRSLKVEV